MGLTLKVNKAFFAGGSSLGMVLRSQQSHADQPLAKRRAADLHVTPHFGIWDSRLITFGLRTGGTKSNFGGVTRSPVTCGTLDVLFPPLPVPGLALVTSAETGET